MQGTDRSKPCLRILRFFRFLQLLGVVTYIAGICSAQANPAALQTLASARISPEHKAQYSDLAQKWMQEYVRIDTTNPPGNEMRAASYLQNILEQEGIETHVFEYAPGRGDLWARLPHTIGEGKRPIILLNHTDVVTSDAAHWKHPPFSGEIADGYLWGRGAQDMKDEGLAQLVTMVMLKREKIALDRDVIFLAVADEEVDGRGTDWFIASHRDMLENAEFMINEGGENIIDHGKLRDVGVDVGEKMVFALHVEAHGKPGHGSRPNAGSAPNRLIHALDRILAYQTPMRVLPVVDEYLKGIARNESPARAAYFADVRKALGDKAFQDEVAHDEVLNYMLHDTISLTMLGGSAQFNVIPPVAWANLDIRLLPGSDPQALLAKLRELVNDPNVSIEPLDKDVRLANYSPTDTALFGAFRAVCSAYFPGAPVVPLLTSGYDENQRYRPLGIDAYGFNPYTATQEESDTEHGNDERIRLEEVRRGPFVLFDVVAKVAGQ